MDDRLDPKDLWKVAFFGTLSVVGVMVFMYWLWCRQWDYYREHGVTTTAVVWKAIPPSYSRPNYTYYVNGVKYNRTWGARRGNHSRCSFNDGDTITILYNPNDPEDSYPACELLDEYKKEAAWIVE